MQLSPHPRHKVLTGSVSLAIAAAALLLVPTQQAAATFPTKCAAGGVKVAPSTSPATVTVTDTTTSSGIPVVVTITGTSFTIAPAGTGVTLETASWCLKAKNAARVHNGTGTSGVSPFTNNNGVVKKIAHVVVYSATSDAFSAARAECELVPDATKTFSAFPAVNVIWECALTNPTPRTVDYLVRDSGLADACVADGGDIELVLGGPPNTIVIACQRALP